MAKQHICPQLKKVSAFTLGCLLTLCGTFPSPGLAVKHVVAEGFPLGASQVLAQAMSEPVTESASDISVEEKRLILRELSVIAMDIDGSEGQIFALVEAAKVFAEI
ncbi:MAG: hypothetical protein AAF810_27505, partial [Cyanobacteria bacterium P01_D01_bin.36]